jgi:hypothetical protein
METRTLLGVESRTTLLITPPDGVPTQSTARVPFSASALATVALIVMMLSGTAVNGYLLDTVGLTPAWRVCWLAAGATTCATGTAGHMPFRAPPASRRPLPFRRNRRSRPREQPDSA